MMLNKYAISAFAVLGAFLIISTGFVQPVSVQASEQTLTSDAAVQPSKKISTLNDPNIGDHLRSLLEDKDLLSSLDRIDRLSMTGQDYKYELRDFASSVIGKDDFKEFTKILEEDYLTISKQMSTQSVPELKDVLDDFNNDNVGAFNGAFKIRIYEKKDRIKTSFLTNMINQVFKNNIFIKNLLANLVNKINPEQPLDNIQPLDEQPVPKVFDITFDLWHRDRRYEDEYRILKDQQMTTITSFLYCLSMLIDVNEEEDLEKREVMIDNYCNSAVGFNSAANDETMIYVKEIVKDEELENLVEDLIRNLDNEDIAKQKATEINKWLLNNADITAGICVLSAICIVPVGLALGFSLIPEAIIEPLDWPWWTWLFLFILLILQALGIIS